VEKSFGYSFEIRNNKLGDLRDKIALQRAVMGCSSVYYICPNIAPDEIQIGKNLLEAARDAGVHQFGYHSVLHPQIETMPHHWQKMRMEEEIFKSGIDFTILQPCAYMQNVLSDWKAIVEQGVYAIPYSTSAKLSYVDLEDVAEAGATVLSEEGHLNAIYELAGPQTLSQIEVALILSNALGKKIITNKLDKSTWAENIKKNKLSDDQIRTLLMMFEYYENYGLVGNSNALEHLLGHPTTTFEGFIKQHIQ
jgi:NAD(P)H dehydrogenase (quinone)